MGSRKRSLAVAALVMLGVAGCVNGDASGNQAADAVENAGASREQANCVGNRLEDRLDQDELNEVAKQDDLAELAGVDVAGSDEDLREVVRRALSTCLEGDEPAGNEAEEGGGGNTSDGTEADSGSDDTSQTTDTSG